MAVATTCLRSPARSVVPVMVLAIWSQVQVCPLFPKRRGPFRAGVENTHADRCHSVKLNASTGTSTRTVSDFNAVGIAWQYRWGGGY